MKSTSITGIALSRLEELGVSIFEHSPSTDGAPLAWPFTSFSQIVFVLEGDLHLFLPDRGRQTIGPSRWFALSLNEWQASLEFRGSLKLVVIECPKAFWEFIVTEEDKLFHRQKACLSCAQRTEAFFFQNRMHPQVRESVTKLANHNGTSPSETLYCQARVLELLAFFAESTSLQLPPSAEPCLRSEDEAALDAAAAYLEENLSEDHSLAKISRTVHLNEFKLKKGFREYHRTTVFGYLRQKRMERARTMLIKQQVKVIEAAQAVGYANPSHFARAFRKTFGMNPREFLASSKKSALATTTLV